MPKDQDTPSIDVPHNLAAEAAVIGAILFDNNAHQRIAEFLRASDFYPPAHQEVYGVADSMIQAGRVADGVTLREHFEKADQLTAIGGATYLAELMESAAFGPEIVDYARIIRELSVRRELIEIGSGVRQRALHPEPEADSEKQIEQAEQDLYGLAERGTASRGFADFKSAAQMSLQMAEAAFQREGKIAGISTHLKELDLKLGGLHPSDLVILAGRPSMGKTSLATNIAFRAARACRRETLENGKAKSVEGAVVGFFSLEM